MALSKECRPIASNGLMAYLAIDDALESIHEENYREAYQACGNAIGHFYLMFVNHNITADELKKGTNPLIEAKRAFEAGKKDDMFDKVITAAEETKDFIFEKLIDCECGEAFALIEEKLGKEALERIRKSE